MNKESRAFSAFQVSEVAGPEGRTVYQGAVVERQIADLPAGELLIQVAYSSVNYKDAMSANGNKGVTRKYPHTPGIDAAGVVIESDVEAFEVGDNVVVTGFDLGMDTAGGFGQFIRVPAAWALKCPAGLSLEESMIIGTAGFTAALCVEKLMLNEVTPSSGPVLVTGASGGVGSFAVALLAQLGYEVTAMSGSADAAQWLRELGASEIIDRQHFADASKRPLLAERWAGAVDVVGGDILFNVIKSLRYGGSVACCGLVAAPMFEATVFPFILRGVNLLGVDSVTLPMEKRLPLWRRLGAEWKLEGLQQLKQLIGLSDLQTSLQSLLKGNSIGRLVVSHDLGRDVASAGRDVD